jgi:hypothetical protein
VGFTFFFFLKEEWRRTFFVQIVKGKKSQVFCGRKEPWPRETVVGHSGIHPFILGGFLSIEQCSLISPDAIVKYLCGVFKWKKRERERETEFLKFFLVRVCVLSELFNQKCWPCYLAVRNDPLDIMQRGISPSIPSIGGRHRRRSRRNST